MAKLEELILNRLLTSSRKFRALPFGPITAKNYISHKKNKRKSDAGQTAGVSLAFKLLSGLREEGRRVLSSSKNNLLKKYIVFV